MQEIRNEDTSRLNAIADRWLEEFQQSIQRGDFAAAASLFKADGYWRDLLALTWDMRTYRGTEAVESGLSNALFARQVHGIERNGDAQAGHLLLFGATIDAFFSFETDQGLCRGVIHLLPPSEGSPDAAHEALAVMTSLETLKAFPTRTGASRDRRYVHAMDKAGKNWLDQRREAQRYADRDPEVLVVGAGQAGLIAAAELGQLGIDTLVIDREARVGDSWRNRYHSLKLHNDVAMNHLPYMPFPETWPVYVPKDMLANWLEYYADALELNVWTQTSLASAVFDEAEGRWTVEVVQNDGAKRTMRPSHVIMATGISGVANIPTIAGSDRFLGDVVHSTGNHDHLDVNGKSVLVVGTGTSAHDIAQDFCMRGADVTMLQRSSTTVVSVEPSAAMMSQLYSDNDGIRPLRDLDLLTASIPYDLLRQLSVPMSKIMMEADRELLEGLARAGFALDNGEDDTGFFMKLLRYHSGYYLNIGASDLIIEGKIKLKSGVGLDRLDGHDAIFTDGSAMRADAIVLATGYKPQQEAVRHMFGDEVADRVGPVWGLDGEGELANMFAPTAQPGFYIVGGPMLITRSYCRYTALSIRAELAGLKPSTSATAKLEMA